jgi:alpha-glucosidase (family GH31 glycosyl hydrolase)
MGQDSSKPEEKQEETPPQVIIPEEFKINAETVLNELRDFPKHWKFPTPEHDPIPNQDLVFIDPWNKRFRLTVVSPRVVRIQALRTGQFVTFEAEEKQAFEETPCIHNKAKGIPVSDKICAFCTNDDLASQFAIHRQFEKENNLEVKCDLNDEDQVMVLNVSYAGNSEVESQILSISVDCKAAEVTCKLSLNDGYIVEWKDKLLEQEAGYQYSHIWTKDPKNLGGTCRTLDHVDGDQNKGMELGKHYETCAKRHGKYFSNLHYNSGLLSRSGYCVVDDTKSPRFDHRGWLRDNPHSSFSKSDPDKKEEQSPQPTALEYRDLYFFGYGFDFESCLTDYYKLSGPQPILPKKALGIWWSRWYPYTVQEIEDLVQEFEDHKVNLSVFCLDMDWNIAGENWRKGDHSYWTGYTWNKGLYPNPKALLQKFKDRGVNVCMNLHPHGGVQDYELQFELFKSTMRSLCTESGERFDEERNDKEYPDSINFNLTMEEYAKCYFKILHKPHEDLGVGVWWIDWQHGESPPGNISPKKVPNLWKTKIPYVDPLFWLNHLHSLDRRRNGRPALIMSRFAGLGGHRYPVGFSGDTFSTWESLDFQPYFTSRASNVGFGWWSHDIGGFQDSFKANIVTLVKWKGSTSDAAKALMEVFQQNSSPEEHKFVCETLKPIAESRKKVKEQDFQNAVRKVISNWNAELYVRWIQLGIFLPIFRVHSIDYLDRKPWGLREPYCSIAVEALRFRNSLIPYIYSVMNSERLLPLIRPMYLKYPRREEAYELKNQFMFGPSVICSPFTSKIDQAQKVASTKLWYPEAGSYFGLLDDNGYLSEARKCHHTGDLASIPAFVKCGSIIPLQSQNGNLTITVFSCAELEEVKEPMIPIEQAPERNVGKCSNCIGEFTLWDESTTTGLPARLLKINKDLRKVTVTALELENPISFTLRIRSSNPKAIWKVEKSELSVQIEEQLCHVTKLQSRQTISLTTL